MVFAVALCEVAWRQRILIWATRTSRTPRELHPHVLRSGESLHSKIQPDHDRRHTDLIAVVLLLLTTWWPISSDQNRLRQARRP